MGQISPTVDTADKSRRFPGLLFPPALMPPPSHSESLTLLAASFNVIHTETRLGSTPTQQRTG